MQNIKTLIVFAIAAVAFGQPTSLPPMPPLPQPPTVTNQQQIFINGMDLVKGNNLTANIGPDGIDIPLAVRLSTGQHLTDLRGLPLTVSMSSPKLKGGYGYRINRETGTISVFSNNEPGPVILSLVAPTTFLGSPSLMFNQVVVNFQDPRAAFDLHPTLLVVANTQKATVGQTVNHTVVLPPGDYPPGDYYLNGFDDNSGLNYVVPLGSVVQPGQAIPISGKQIKPYDQAGWFYGRYQLVDNKRPGLSVGFGSGYVNMKYAFRNLDVLKDSGGNITFTLRGASESDSFRVYLATTDGFCVELPVAPPAVILNGGVELKYYKGYWLNGPLVTAGEYTPIVVQRFSDGGTLVHSLPNGLYLDGEPLPFPILP